MPLHYMRAIFPSWSTLIWIAEFSGCPPVQNFASWPRQSEVVFLRCPNIHVSSQLESAPPQATRAMRRLKRVDPLASKP